MCSQSGGIFRCREISVLAGSFHVPTILHGSMSLLLAGWLQATLAIGAPWQEVALITRPLLQEEQWAPALTLLKSKSLFTFENGDLLAPSGPGLGWTWTKRRWRGIGFRGDGGKELHCGRLEHPSKTGEHDPDNFWVTLLSAAEASAPTLSKLGVFL